MRLQISLKLFSQRLVLVFIVFSFSILCEAQNTSISVISYPKTFPVVVVNDIQSLFQTSTGQHWTTQEDKPSNTGLILLINLTGSYKTGESCLINSDGSSYVKFESPTTNGLIYGVYKYLRDLGFKFYLPDSLYTIVPKLISVFKKTSVMETPFLRIRDFFGTGGFGSGKTDPGDNVEKAWQLWKWRNGFGTEFHLSGHVGETFNLANAKELEKNPSWNATPILKNGKVDASTKLNYYNSEAVDFFTDWVIKKYTDKNYNSPPVYLTDMVSIEPADGGGYITDVPAGSDLKTVSDQVFHAANVAAEKLDHFFPNQPNIGVNLYAYSSHADVPNFALNPRVFVQLVPYQFQNVASGPAFIKRWSGKAKRFGLYDYFKYPDSYWDMPGRFTIDELMKRSINAANAGSEGTTFESSYSKFATAIPLWIVCQYMCSGNTDWQKNYESFINDLYGNAAPVIKDLFDIFYRQNQFNAQDLTTAVNEIQKAEQLTNDQQILHRIDELKLYLSYVHLYLKSQDTGNGDLEQRLIPLDKMIWTLYQTKIVHGYRLMQLISYGFLNAKITDKSLANHYHDLHLKTFAESKDQDALWKGSFGYTADEIKNIYNEIKMPASVGSIAKKNVVAENPAAVTNGNNSITDQVKAARSFNPKQKITIAGTFRNRGSLSLFSEKPATITISWTLTNSKNQTRNATLSGASKSYETVYDYPLKSESGNLSISLPAGESDLFINAGANTSYTLNISLNDVFCFFNGSPRGKISFLDEHEKASYDPSYFPSYIYIPRDVTEVQYKIKVDALKITDPAGNAVETKVAKTLADGFQVRSFTVLPNLAGQFWKVVISGNNNYQFLNIPDRYFLLIPK